MNAPHRSAQWEKEPERLVTQKHPCNKNHPSQTAEIETRAGTGQEQQTLRHLLQSCSIRARTRRRTENIRPDKHPRTGEPRERTTVRTALDAVVAVTDKQTETRLLWSVCLSVSGHIQTVAAGKGNSSLLELQQIQTHIIFKKREKPTSD